MQQSKLRTETSISRTRKYEDHDLIIFHSTYCSVLKLKLIIVLKTRQTCNVSNPHIHNHMSSLLSWNWLIGISPGFVVAFWYAYCTLLFATAIRFEQVFCRGPKILAILPANVFPSCSFCISVICLFKDCTSLRRLSFCYLRALTATLCLVQRPKTYSIMVVNKDIWNYMLFPLPLPLPSPSRLPLPLLGLFRLRGWPLEPTKFISLEKPCCSWRFRVDIWLSNSRPFYFSLYCI